MANENGTDVKLNLIFENKTDAKMEELLGVKDLDNVSEKTKRYIEDVAAGLQKSYKDLVSHQKVVDTRAKLMAKMIEAEGKQTTLKAIKENMKLAKEVFEKAHPTISKAMQKTANIISSVFKKLFNDIKRGILEAFDPSKGIASYDMSTSLFTNAEARQRSMRYGLSAGQTYALTKTMDMLNMGEEDLMWMNEAQKEKFNELMNKYSNLYDNMTNNGFAQGIQEAQLEIKMLKEDLKNKFLTWFSANKEAIIGSINAILSVLKGLASFVMSILNILSFGRFSSNSSALSADELNNTSNYNNKQINLNQTVNNNNNINSEAEAKSLSDNITQNTLRTLAQAIKTY